MKWLLDTNVVSEPTRPRPEIKVLGWIREQVPSDLAISVVTLAELHDGASMHLDPKRREYFERWIETGVAPSFKDRTLSLTFEILVEWMRLGRLLGARGRPQSAPDLLIAATARVHNLVVATRAVRGFANTGITVYNPWTDETDEMEAP